VLDESQSLPLDQIVADRPACHSVAKLWRQRCEWNRHDVFGHHRCRPGWGAL